LLKGETALDLAIQTQNRFMIYMLMEEARMRSRRNNRLLRIMEKYEVISLMEGKPQHSAFRVICNLTPF